MISPLEEEYSLNQENRNFILSVVAVAMLVLFSYFAYCIIHREKALLEANDLLDEKVKLHTKELEKTKEELELLNRDLETRIHSEVEKNRQKDRQMIHQSRLAQMGEMLSMITHQWRQPLASITSATSTLKIKMLKERYDKELFLEKVGNITEYAQHLSSTIDDFADFFKPNKEKREMSCNEVVDNALKIIHASLKDKGVKVHKSYQFTQKIYLFPSELKQVILNVIKNAEDAFSEREILKPELFLSIFKEGREAVITIEDNAGGVS